MREMAFLTSPLSKCVFGLALSCFSREGCTYHLMNQPGLPPPPRPWRVDRARPVSTTAPLDSQAAAKHKAVGCQFNNDKVLALWWCHVAQR